MSTEGTEASAGAGTEGQQTEHEHEQEVPVVIHQKSAGQTTTTPIKKPLLTENAPAGAMFVVFMASLVLLIQTCNDCMPTSQCKNNVAWGLALSVISVTISLISYVVLAGLEKSPDFTQEKPNILLRVASIILFALWIPGAGVLTFKGPYFFTGNAYFACWLGFIASAFLFYIVNRPKMPSVIIDTRTVSLFLIMLAAIILLVQASIDCPPEDSCKDEHAWALSVGIVVTVLCFVALLVLHFRDDLLGTWGTKMLAILLFAIWIPGAGVLTFRAPYTVTSNAYFACWGGFLASGYFFFATFFPHKVADLHATEAEKQQSTS